MMMDQAKPSSPSQGFRLPTTHNSWNTAKPANSSWRELRSLSGLHDNGTNSSKSLLRTDISIDDSSFDAKQFSSTTTVLDKKDSTNPAANVFSPTFTGRFPGPIHCMDMHHDLLLVGSTNGDCFLKTFDVTTEKNNCLLDISPNNVVKCRTFSHPKLKKTDALLTVPSPEQYTFSTKINNVQIQPCEQPTTFHTIENNRLHVWSFEKEDAPIQTIQGSRSPLWCSSWSVHNNNLILIGGVSKSVKLLDIRTSGGADHCVKLWSLRLEPHHVLSTLDKGYFTDSIVGLHFSYTQPNQFFAQSASGELIAVSISPEQINSLVQHRLEDEKTQAENEAISNIETLIYHRNLNQAFLEVEKIATKLKEQNKLEKALKLLDLCKVRTVSENVKSNNPKARFKKELEDFSKKVTELIKTDSQRIEISTIKDVINLYLAHDYRRGMTLAIDIAEIFRKDGEKFTEYMNIVKEVLSPTIFEVTHNQALRESGYRSLAKAFQNQDYIIEQLKLQRDVFVLYGMAVLRAYLNALLCQQLYDKFFIVCTKLLQKIQGYDIAVIVRDLMKNVAFADLMKLLNSEILNSEFLNTIETKSSISAARSFPAAKCLDFIIQTKQTVFAVIRITMFCPVLPSYMNTIIQATIQKLVVMYEFAFEQIGKSVQHQNQGRKFAEEILKRFELKKLASKDDLPDHQAEIVKLLPILEEFLKN
ncbi:hypothetical protein FDP41_007932 [Naegleria fowleri]|uniref:Uncharacterized protein n=1 Tax=Naegleria fowleri TaxID=5763 RepID=A0A6A5C3S7_NAEFO|nr:uncharacterized protein FDP41_007932 [Naegleria fowleri]KAF0984017.1 hypothetical protein FDP41_007932 [Naegleria fowleri]